MIGRDCDLLCLMVCVALMPVCPVQAEEPVKGKDGGILKYGVLHDVAEDREFERIGGKYEPEGLDKYMKRHFDLMAARLDKLEEHLTRMDSRLDGLEKKMTSPGPASPVKSELENAEVKAQLT